MNKLIKDKQIIEDQIEAILKKLTLKEKVALLSGKDFWGTASFESKGVSSVVVTDGPHGVRIGNEFSDREKNRTATAFPTGVAMASSWDPDLIREVGIALAEETRANKCDVLLGPCVNIVRIPVAGRNFESYAEDPYLAGKIGIGYVEGLQSRGIGASLKHFACNNQEIERTRGSSNLDERTLREIYLTAFEMIVKEANPWTIMCSYNRINGEHASQNRHLLTDILKEEWGYDGVVVSDWNANHTIFESVKAGLDLEMPGPSLYYGKFLEEAVKTWQIDESVVDEAARRILRLGKRVDLYKRANPGDHGAFSNDEHKALARKLAESSSILLKNSNNLLPLKKEELKKVAVIGPVAAKASYNGGGSSIVKCEYSISPLEGLQKFYGDSVDIEYTQGCTDKIKPDTLESVGISFISDGKAGLLEEYYTNREFSGEPFSSEISPHLDFWSIFPPKGVDPANYSVRWSGDMQVERSGNYRLQLNYQGLFNFYINDELVLLDHNWKDVPPYPFYTIQKKELYLEKGKTYSFRFEFRNTLEHERQAIVMNAEYLITEDEVNAEIEKAVNLAKGSDAALIFAGHAVGFECEAEDRKSIKLPGDQDRLIKAVCEANPNTVVVLNTGAPVEMPWVNEVPSIVQAHFFGQEGGHALAALLNGQVNPSGKLTTSYPLRNQDNPAYLTYPGTRDHNYGEGVFVGYRYYDFKEMDVLFPFGHGLSYTNFEYSGLTLTGSLKKGDLTARFKVKNCGTVEGAEIAQLYVADTECSELRPPKELKGFKKVFLKAGEEQEVALTLDERSFAFYDNYRNDWIVEPGRFEILAGASSRDIRLKTSLEI